MKMLSNNEKGILIFMGAFLAPCLICLGQTNASQQTGPSEKTTVSWVKAAKSYALAQRTGGSSQTTKANSSAKTKKASAPADQPAPPSDERMNAETESAQFQRIEEEGLFQTRKAMKEAEHELTLQSEMGMLSRNPEALCLGESLIPLRVLGSGTASGVP
ncbi:MAG: hypothetical protein ACLQVY_20620 [Limisphaerales bacterium]